MDEDSIVRSSYNLHHCKACVDLVRIGGICSHLLCIPSNACAKPAQCAKLRECRRKVARMLKKVVRMSGLGVKLFSEVLNKIPLNTSTQKCATNKVCHNDFFKGQTHSPSRFATEYPCAQALQCPTQLNIHGRKQLHSLLLPYTHSRKHCTVPYN